MNRHVFRLDAKLYMIIINILISGMGGIIVKAEELCRILIVDDEQLIWKGIIHYMDWEQEGFMIAGEASNGREALEY
jgi:hypothetical protein